ncbi:DUF2147 domain-containing protein [Persicitalea sp.]|uniref:DUF2147 domain-containing protein n=1 Tax=Persicitalea sp. TaxID=3100273 RepID=UPI0035941343
MRTGKSRFYLILPLLLLLITSSSFIPADNPDAVIGTWLTGSKKGRVQIYKQGNAYFGKIVWLQEPNDPKTGNPKTDISNPNPKKRDQPLLGLVNLRDFRYDGDNVWDEGKIYDPENGKEYSCKMTLRDDNTLDVRGYVGFSLLGRTDTWQRVK